MTSARRTRRFPDPSLASVLVEIFYVSLLVIAALALAGLAAYLLVKIVRAS